MSYPMTVGIMKRTENYFLTHFEGEETFLRLRIIALNDRKSLRNEEPYNKTSRSVWYSRCKHGGSTFPHVFGLLSPLTTGKCKDSAFRSRAMSYAVSRRPITA